MPPPRRSPPRAAFAAALAIAAAAAPARASDPVAGIALNCHHISSLPLYLESVDAIAAMGANALLVVTPMFMDAVDASEIRFEPGRCPTDEQLVAILRRGEERGLRTTLLPIVLVSDPGEEDWRGVIRPADRDAWWASYQAFMERFLGVAAAAGVDDLSVGSELNSMEADVGRWREVIALARQRFGGRLTYTANWDRYEKVHFWRLLDYVSVSAYFELAPGEPAAPRERLAAAWAGPRERLLRFAGRCDRPVLLMELGYPTLARAAAHPWNYVASPGDLADPEAQARCWRAFFDAWSEALADPRVPAMGFFCYAWDPYHAGGPRDTGYGIRGKPAFDVVREGIRTIREKVSG